MRFIPIILLTIAFCLLASQKSFAQAQKSNITVSPQLIQLDLSKDPPEAEFTYTNSTNQTIELVLSIEDIKELEDRGIPEIIDPNVTRDYRYGLSQWARFSNQNLIIPPNQSKTVKIYVDKNRLTVGGHYATVLAELKQNDDQKTVKLRAILSSLLFVRTGGGNEQERANIISISTDSEWLSFPGEVSFRLQNNGNVEVIPYGLVKVYDPFEREIARGIINENSLITLPDSTRRYAVPLKRAEGFIFPGLHKVEVEAKYGKTNSVTKREEVFLTLGSINKWAIVLILVVALGSIIAVKLRKKPLR